MRTKGEMLFDLLRGGKDLILFAFEARRFEDLHPAECEELERVGEAFAARELAAELSRVREAATKSLDIAEKLNRERDERNAIMSQSVDVAEEASRLLTECAVENEVLRERLAKLEAALVALLEDADRVYAAWDKTSDTDLAFDMAALFLEIERARNALKGPANA